MVSVGPLLELSHLTDQQPSSRGQRFSPLESFLLLLVILRKGLGLSTCTFLGIVSLAVGGCNLRC